MADEINKGKNVLNAASEWIDQIIFMTVKFVKEMHRIISFTKVMLGESQTQIMHWKAEVERLSTLVSQLIEVEKYGTSKFLKENPLQLLDANFIYVLRKNIA